MTTPFTYGPIDELLTEPTYTSVQAVKDALGIRDATFDEPIKAVCISAETWINSYLGRSFPDGGDNPEWAGIPERVSDAALKAVLELFKLQDAPGGVAGSDSAGYIGIWDPATANRLAFNVVKPELSGFKIQHGVA